MMAIHNLDRTKGLDLIIHTPGGNIAATESIVDYLRRMFPDDIRAIIPQIAMSAGTMLACACNTILMAKSLNSKDNYRASRLTAIWMQANVTKAARVPARFS